MVATARAFTIRRACATELTDINGVIRSAVFSWHLPDRLKRLAEPVLRYDAVDFHDYELLVAERCARIVAVAAWDPLTALVGPDAAKGALLHGLYVRGNSQRGGLGTAPK